MPKATFHHTRFYCQSIGLAMAGFLEARERLAEAIEPLDLDINPIDRATGKVWDAIDGRLERFSSTRRAS